MSGNGLAAARARRRRRIIAKTIPDTTIRRIAAPDAIKTVWYSSTRIRIVGDDAKACCPALGQFGEPDVRTRHPYHTCGPAASQRISASNLKARVGHPMRQVSYTPRDARRDGRSGSRLWQGDPTRPTYPEPSARRDHVR